MIFGNKTWHFSALCLYLQKTAYIRIFLYDVLFDLLIILFYSSVIIIRYEIIFLLNLLYLKKTYILNIIKISSVFIYYIFFPYIL